MAQDSKRKRRERRLKRATSQAFRLMEHALNERDVYRQIAVEQLTARKLDEQAKEQEAESLIVRPTMKETIKAQFGTEKL